MVSKTRRDNITMSTVTEDVYLVTTRGGFEPYILRFILNKGPVHKGEGNKVLVMKVLI